MVSNAEVMVVRAEGVTGELCSGGHLMVARGTEPGDPMPIDPAFDGALPIGKRFSLGGLEVMVTKAGAGLLSMGGELLTQKDPRHLPSSD